MIRNSLPNFFTLGNLFLGILSIIMIFKDNAETAAILVIVAMLLDGLDGRVARALNAQSEFGKELDSLSDIISFGVAPAFVMYVASFQDLNAAAGWIVTAIFPICGALRLARFNVVAGTPGYFVGLPIPAAGGILCTLALFSTEIPTPVLFAITVLLSYLMVSKLKYPNFKKVGLSKSSIWIIPILLVVSTVVIFKFPGASKLLLIPLLLYALLGLKKNVDLIRRLRRRRRRRQIEENAKTEIL